MAPCLDDGKPIPSFWANDRHPSLSCPGISRHLEVRCHHGWKEGPWILAVFWKMEVEVVEGMLEVWRVLNDGTKSACDWCGEMRKP